MEVLQRLQPLDILFLILWAAIVGWGLQTGIVRQLGMLVGVYGAALVAGSAYQRGGTLLASALGKDVPQLEFIAYVALLLVVFGLIGLLISRAYPTSKFSHGFGTDNVVGGALGAIWGVLFLIALLTMLRFYAVVPWSGEQARQQSVARQLQLSQVAPALEGAASPLWQAMTPWFPAQVRPTL